MQRYKPAEGAPLLRTTDGEAFPEAGKMIDPANRYYARLISEGALELTADDEPQSKPRPSKPAAAAASNKETRK
ncbi:hypothetical protein [Hoeflea sp. EC-HK425]|uniref:hypothetical protein n=1 Tax=Hoeflea sp. EC-HK425 TaxID=2038388 RepID=UPI001257CCED|nr:hypothetical protein [Hoeflea sp. EC-HK425]MBV6650478.1 hypothetical protein [Hoeflea sp.]VVT15125.1 conserved hypothetical protein [Hoeflea sp. EC-HK425]